MGKPGLTVIDRRMAIGGAIAGAAGLALPFRQGKPVTQRGMAGGGLARFEEGEANFSFFASRMVFSGEDADIVVGSIIWVDAAAGLTMRSTEITAYIVPPVQPEGGVSRQVIGTMSVDDEDEYPFELEIIDADVPGSGRDMVNLKVGDGARTSENAPPASGLGYSYVANGAVISGDIQELDLEIDLTTGQRVEKIPGCASRGSLVLGSVSYAPSGWSSDRRVGGAEGGEHVGGDLLE